MTIKELLRNTDLPPLERELLLAHAVSGNREYLFAHPEKKISGSAVKKYKNLSRKRRRGEPMAYILGRKEFFGLNFFVNGNVLIPRPETELMVELALEKINEKKRAGQEKVIADMGTGSGNVLIAIAKNISEDQKRYCRLIGLDISRKALSVAKINLKKHRLEGKVNLIESDLFKNSTAKIPDGDILVVVANLPYVSSSEYKKLEKEVKDFEPKISLFAPQKGLAAYNESIRQLRLIKESKKYKEMITFFEVSPWQKDFIKAKIKNHFRFPRIKIHRDLSGSCRVIEFSVKKQPALLL